MSKQSDAKKEQGYRVQAACCKNCKNFSSEMVPALRWQGDHYISEKNKRCEVGGFAVQNTGHCALFGWKA
jgi:hypothetical protein